MAVQTRDTSHADSAGVTVTSLTVPIPSVQAGDLLIGFVGLLGNPDISTTPSGWARAGAFTRFNTAAMVVYTRTATGAETQVVFGFTDSRRAAADVRVYSGADTITVAGGDGTDASPTAPAVSSTAGDMSVIGYACEDHDRPITLTNPAGYSNIENNSPSTMALLSADDVLAGAGGSVGISADGSTRWAASHVAIQPAPDTPNTGATSTSVTWATTTTGGAPVVPSATGETTSTIQWSTTTTGAAPAIPDAAGTTATTVQWSTHTTGQAPAVGSAAGTTTSSVTWSTTTEGSAPSIPTASGTTTATVTWTTTTTGRVPAQTRLLTRGQPPAAIIYGTTPATAVYYKGERIWP